MYEPDGEVRHVYPNEARLRGLTYVAPLYIDIIIERYALSSDHKCDFIQDTPTSTQILKHEFLCYMPIMLRSKFCLLHSSHMEKSKVTNASVGECVFDQGGYFVINGSEKVKKILFICSYLSLLHFHLI